MTIQETFIVAEKALQNVINQITDQQMAQPASPSMTRGKEMSLREIINYHAYDDIWVPEVLDGKTVDEVGNKYDGDLLGDDFKDSYTKITDNTQAVVANFTDLEKIVHLSYGDFPAFEYLKHVTSFRGFRSYTIAYMLGLDTTMPAELVAGLNEYIVPDVDQWRAMGVFKPEIPAPNGADDQTKLLCITGFYEQI